MSLHPRHSPLMDDNNISYLIVNSLKSHGTPHGQYKGTFTADSFHELIRHLNFKNLDKAPIYFIVNTLTSRSNHSEIGHWLAVSLNYVSSKNMVNLKFFDSFAKNVGYYRPHISKAVKYIRLKCRKLNIRLAFDSLTKPIQAIGSKLCGIYAALFVIKSVLQKKSVKYLPCLNLTFLGKNL